MEYPSKDLEQQALMQKRTLYAVASVLGKECTLSMKSGEKFTGRLFTYVNEGVILKSCARADAPEDANTQVFHKGTFESMSFCNVAPHNFRKFKTDTQISNSRSGKNRDLQKWEGEGEDEVLLAEEGDAKFDQFAVNEVKFGVKSDYREEFYTTNKVEERELTEEQRIRAERVEREILSKSKIDEYVEDEEASFSAVLGYGRFADRIPPPAPETIANPVRRFRGKASRDHDKQPDRYAEKKLDKQPHKSEPKPFGLIVGVPSFVPEVTSPSFPPLGVPIQAQSVEFIPLSAPFSSQKASNLPLSDTGTLTLLFLEGASIFTDSRLCSHEWTPDLIT